MGLDVYVGPLCRYYAGAWLTTLQREMPALGVEVQIVRPDVDPEEITDPVEAQPVIEEWRDGLQEALAGEGAEVDWEENPEGDYFTDKPAWESYIALMLWACYREQTELQAPATCPDEWQDDPAYLASTDDEFETRYPHLLHDTEIWLPGDFAFTFTAEDPSGAEMVFGSTTRLLAELEALNNESWKLDDAHIEEHRRAGSDAGAPLEHAARFGISVLLPLARKAVAERLPLKLDY
jgi:hypothetical protein